MGREDEEEWEEREGKGLRKREVEGGRGGLSGGWKVEKEEEGREARKWR